VWGRRADAAAALADDARALGWEEVAVAATVEDVFEQCGLVITVTSSTSPIVPSVSLIRPGTTIVAVGSDGIGKQELAAEVSVSCIA
jgi:ornithine cyclodeaminase/alanine dehydrogenase-like protein (mu-crystallin family)